MHPMIMVTKIPFRILLAAMMAFVVTSCTSSTPQVAPETSKPSAQTTPKTSTSTVPQMTLTSPAFESGQPLPARFSCNGEGASPPFNIEDVPAAAESIAFIMEDPDAPNGTFTHWIIWNWPAAEPNIPAALPTQSKFNNGAIQGKNSSGKIGFTPPCPPNGTHRYYVKAYALNTLLDLPLSSHKKDLLAAMKGHILAQGSLMTTYHKP